ncbi:inositol monophosphatase [Aureobasidium pullulans]|nr:inositol monophosphatase [Aureobasidium pullulans]
MSDINLQEVHDFLVDVAKQAGEVITAARPSTTAAGEKKNSVDLVTETDQATERLITDLVRKSYPHFEFMGEETYKPGDKLTDSPTLIVDPVDGTTNLVHRYPYISVSLGLAINRKPVVGVIYNPFGKTLFSGIKGKGSFLSDPFHDHVRLPLKEPEPLTLDKALVAVEWGSDRAGHDYDVKVKTFRNLCASAEEGGAMVHGIRSFGSAALNLCGVAAGHLDAYWEAGCWAWDVCAGWVILEEAGGQIVDANKGNWQPEVDGRRYLAVRKGERQNAFIEELWGHVAGDLNVGIEC